jgi:hypothetical protein
VPSDRAVLNARRAARDEGTAALESPALTYEDVMGALCWAVAAPGKLAEPERAASWTARHPRVERLAPGWWTTRATSRHPAAPSRLQSRVGSTSDMAARGSAASLRGYASPAVTPNREPRNLLRLGNGSGAIIEGVYRYSLWRTTDAGKATRRVLFIMLNPSTADASQDDPTLRRCLGFARTWRYGSLEVCNLFALRSPSPRSLLAAGDPTGPRNDEFLRAAVARADTVVAAWGAHHVAQQRALEVLAMLPSGRDVSCLGTTKGGYPRHPLYVHRDTSLRRFYRPRAV